MSHVLTKSARGLREASGKTTELPEELREVLKLCRGQFVAEELVASVPPAEREALARALVSLTDTGYLREVAEIDVPSIEEIDSPDEPELSPESAHQLRAEVAARRGQRDDEAAEQLRQAEELARRRAAEKAAQEAAEAARREAEERARREAETRARIEAEEKAKLEALERERVEAEEKARRDAAERTRRAAEEKARRDAAEKARREAEEKARRAAEERELEEMRERLRLRAEGRRRVLAPTIVAILLVPVFLIWGLGHLPMAGKRDEFVQRASQTLGVPVRIGAARFVPLPQPQWQLDDVVVGEAEAVVKVQRVDVQVPLSALWSLPETLGRVHLDVATVPVAALARILGGAGPAPALGIAELSGREVQLLAGKPLSPPLQLTAHVDNGRLRDLAAQGESAELGKFTFAALRPGDSWQIDIQASRCELPFGAALNFTDCVLKGRFSGQALQVSSFAARAHSGDVLLNGTLAWAGPWTANGSVELKRLDVSQVAPAWFKDGFLSAKGEFAASAATPEALLAGTHLAGAFQVASGVLAGIDLDRVVQGRGIGEQFRFDTLDGQVLIDSGRADLTALRLAAGALSADGSVSIDAAHAVRGRLAAEVRTGSSRLAGGASVAGSLTKPVYQP